MKHIANTSSFSNFWIVFLQCWKVKWCNNFVSQKNENFILNHLFKIENHFKHAHAFF